MVEERGVYRVLVGKPEGKRPLGRPRRRWVYNIRMDKSNKHQLDATLCRFYFCRVTLHVSGASAHHQEYLKLVQRPLVHVFCKIYNILTLTC